MKVDFFISYSYKDEEYALWIDKILRDNGFTTITEIFNFNADSNIETEIEKVCKEVKHIIAIISNNYLSSDFSRKEWNIFLLQNNKSKSKGILPIVVEEELKIDNFLGDLRYIDIPKIINESDEEEIEEKVKDFILKEIRVIKGEQLIYKEVKFPFRKKNNKVKYITREIPEMIKDTNFVGRKTELESIDNLLKENNIVYITGMAGIGKTALCKNFFCENYGKYAYAGWINYSGTLIDSLVGQLNVEMISEYPSYQQKSEKIIEFLINIDEDALLIIDEVPELNDLDINILKKLKFKILITSRNFSRIFDQIHIDILTESDSEDIFYHYYSMEKNSEYLKKILQLTGNHPLSIKLSANIAESNKYNLQEFYQKLKYEVSSLESSNLEVEDPSYKGEFKLSDLIIKKIELQNLNNKEISIMINLCILPDVYIDLKDIKKWLNLESFDSICSLIEKKLVICSESSVKINKIAKETVKEKIKPDVKMCANLIKNLAEDLNLKPYENFIHKVKYIIFGEAVLENLLEEDLSMARLANNMAIICKNTGEYNKALKFMLRTVEIAKKVLELDNIEMSTFYNNISMVYQNVGENDKALEFGLRSIKIREKVLELDHPDLASFYENISMVYQNRGENDKALEFGLKSIEIREKSLELNHPDLASSYNNISMAYQNVGEYDKALEFGLKALEMREKVLEQDHPDLASSYNNISMAYQNVGEYDKALEFGLKALEMREKVLEQDHPDLASSYNNISIIYQGKSENDEALKFALKALEIRKKVLKSNHPSLANSYNNVAMAYRKKGKYNEALNAALEAIKIREEVLEPNHPDLAASYNDASLIYRNISEYSKALELGEKARKILTEMSVINYADLAICYNNMSLTYQGKAKHDKALEFALKAIETFEKVLPVDHPYLANFYSNISIIYRSMGNNKEAYKCENKSLQIEKIRKALSKDAEIEDIEEAIDICKNNKGLEVRLNDLENLKENKAPELTKDIYLDNENKKSLPKVIKSFFIKNFQCIKEMEFKDIPVDCNWIFITGENGDGKTSVLQALALGLLGEDMDDNKLLERKSKIKVELKDENRSGINKLYYKISNWNNFESSNDVIGYGVYRLAMQSSNIKEEKYKDNSAYSLFNEGYGNLLSIENWFREEQLKKSNTIEKVKEVILELLPSVEDIIFRGEKIIYKEKGFETSFKQLSSGNKNIIAMIGDMIIRLMINQNADDLRDLKGIVFIDELDLHLHPCWQKKLPELLTKLFPKIQFWASTHSIVPFMGAPKNSIFLRVKRDKIKGTEIHKISIDMRNISPNILISSPLFDVSLMSSQNEDPAEFNTHKDYMSFIEDKKLNEELALFNEKGLNFDEDFFD